MITEYGELKIQLEIILNKKGISKYQICKDLDISNTNFNRWYYNEVERMDISMLCKLCHFLEIDISELLTYTRPEDME